MSEGDGVLRDRFIGLAGAYAEGDRDAIQRMLKATVAEIAGDGDRDAMLARLIDYLAVSGGLSGALVAMAATASRGLLSVEDVITTIAAAPLE